MAKFKLICPDCGATVVTASPEAVIWELCPGCNHHLWDGFDALMAEVVAGNSYSSASAAAIMRAHIS